MLLNIERGSAPSEDASSVFSSARRRNAVSPRTWKGCTRPPRFRHVRRASPVSFRILQIASSPRKGGVKLPERRRGPVGEPRVLSWSSPSVVSERSLLTSGFRFAPHIRGEFAISDQASERPRVFSRFRNV